MIKNWQNNLSDFIYNKTIDKTITFGDTIHGQTKIFGSFTLQNTDQVIDYRAINNKQSLRNGLTSRYGNSIKLETDINIFQDAVSPVSDDSCDGYYTTSDYQELRTDFEFLGYHDGIDLAKSSGCDIVSVKSGEKTHHQDYGLTVRVKHSSRLSSLYGHGRSFAGGEGAVKTEEKIMYMGSTGYSSGVHLHFGMYVDAKHVNPRNFFYFPKKGCQDLGGKEICPKN